MSSAEERATNWPPHHTAEEVADRLRFRIKDLAARKLEIETRRVRVGEEYQERIDHYKGFDVSKLHEEWAYKNQELRKELAACDEAVSELRNILQWLTGELWS